MSDPDTKTVAIIGGGLGGLTLATKLGRQFRASPGVKIHLIDRAPVHVWKPNLHKFAAGTANAYQDGVSLVGQAHKQGFVYFPGSFTGLDLSEKTIAIEIADLPGKPTLEHTMGYDIAVFALGGTANDFGTPGVADHCHVIDTLWGAEALNSALRAEIAHSCVTGADITIAIVGAGATGVEFAAEVAHLVEIGAAFGAADLPGKLKVTLIDGGSSVLGGFPDGVVEGVTRKLEDLGIQLELNTRVARADEAGFELADGRRVDGAIRVWAAGVKAAPAVSNLSGLVKTSSGHLVVNEFLRADGASHEIYALGDCSSYRLPDTDCPLPPTGQVARQQANYLAGAIAARLAGKPVSPFGFVDSGSLVSLSRFGGYGEISRHGIVPSIALSGWIARCAHNVFYRMHQNGLFGPVSTALLMARDAIDATVRPPARLD